MSHGPPNGSPITSKNPNLKQVGEPSRAMGDANYFDPMRNLAVENKVTANREIPEFRRYIGSCRSEVGILCQHHALRVEVIEHAVSCYGIVLGDVDPDFDQIFLGLGRSS